MLGSEALIKREVIDYLDLHHVITLSTASFTGMPHAATVVFASDERQLYFFSAADSILSHNIRDNRHVSFTVDDYTIDWRKVRELQGVGRCTPATADVEGIVAPILGRKFGYGFSRPPGVLYTVIPVEMHFVDYTYEMVRVGQEPAVRERMVYRDETTALPDRGAVATELGRTVFEPGEVIFRPGRGSGKYYVVVEGEVEVRAEGHGADQTVYRVVSGQMFGDQTALRGQVGQLTAHAITRTVLLEVAREAIRDISL